MVIFHSYVKLPEGNSVFNKGVLQQENAPSGAHPRSFPLANDLAKTVERAETLPTIHLGARDFLPTPMTEH